MQHLIRRTACLLENHALSYHALRTFVQFPSLSRTLVTSGQRLDQQRVAHRHRIRAKSRPYNFFTDQGSSEKEASAATGIASLDVTEAKNPAPEPVIRWYNQLSPWSKQRWLADPDNPDADDDTGEIKQLKQEIDRLDNELQEMSGDGPGGKTLIEPLLQALPPEEQEKVREYIRREESLEQKRADALALYLPKLEIKWELPPQQNVYLRQLNANIRTASMRMGEYTLRRQLWQSYARCKAFLPPFTHLIPEDSWMVLFNAQALASVRDDPHWASHLIILLEDMKGVGKQLRGDQLMLYIEALRFEGRSDKAIREWQDLRKLVENDKQASAEYELLGVRLFTSQGDLGKAEEIASRYLEGGEKSESRILIPIMDTWIQREDEIGMKHAWALYLRFKMGLGTDITMADYDSVSLSFLRGNRTDLALAVFKDMMLTGQQTNQGSVELYENSLGLVERMQKRATSMPEVNKISLTAMTVLPKAFHNKYFYGSWIKKLIGMDEADSAASVVELMYERGITPAPKHLNGIIGAWLRTRSDHHKEKAEQMAWAMVYQRLNFVKARNKGEFPPGPTTAVLNDLVDPLPLESGRRVPAATIETFCLLLQYYGRRSKWNNVHIIQNALGLGQLQPNSYWINHLLHMDLRQGLHGNLWTRYVEMFDSVVRPDLETFTCLWKCEQAHLGLYKLKEHRQCNFPNARRIMWEMVSWLKVSDANQRHFAQDDFDRELYERIIRCMVQMQDLPGAIVALYALKDYFEMYPDKKTHQLIGRHIVRLLHSNRQTFSRRRFENKMARKPKEATIQNILQLVHNERARTLVEAGYDDFEELSDEIRSEERLYVLAEFLRTIMRKTMPSETDIEGKIKEAASEMGVVELKIEDPLPYYRDL